MLERICFFATLGAAILLAGSVGAAPWLTQWGAESQLVTLYAEDTTVRRTSLAAALGLTATAFVFFRPKRLLGKRTPDTEAPDKIAGA